MFSNNPGPSLFIVAFLLAALASLGQSKPLACADIKNGIFHFYPKNSATHFLEVRNGEFLQETTVNTGDTALWQIKWTNDCTYSLKYVSGNAKMTPETMAFLKKHRLVFEITSVTNDFYLFKGYVDNTSNLPIQTDTMWLNERSVAVNNELFKQVENANLLRKNHFSDTSRYAVLYLYRPGKLSNSAGSYIIYFNDNLMCVAKNRSGYIFKILQEGRFNVKSSLYKDESSVDLDVKFGQTYYVKSMIHWGIYSRLNNFKLEMAAVKAEDGKIEFADVNLQ